MISCESHAKIVDDFFILIEVEYFVSRSSKKVIDELSVRTGWFS